jgi:hypothetical protein
MQDLSMQQTIGTIIIASILGGLGLIPFITGLVMIVRSTRVIPTGKGIFISKDDYFKDRQRILEIVASGKISGQEAERLLASLDQGNNDVLYKVASSPTIRWGRVVIGLILILVSFWFFSTGLDYANAALGRPFTSTRIVMP